MKFYEEVEDTADTLGDMVTTLQDIPGVSDYITEDEMNQLWDAYDILMNAAELIAQDESELEDELE